MIAKEDKIPLGQKIAFAAGGGIDALGAGLGTGMLWMPFFNIGLGLNPVLLGAILMVYRLWDAITDPIIGNISDNTRTRWGRRRPYLVLAPIMVGIVYPFLFFPPTGRGEAGIVAHLIVVGLFLFVGTTLWAMPYYGFQLELTPNYDERTRLTAWMSVFSKLNPLIAGWALALVTSKLFADPATGQPDVVRGIQVFTLCSVPVLVLFGMLPGLFVKERYYEKEAKHQAKESLWRSVKESGSCGPLWVLIAVSFFNVLGFNAVGVVGQYVNIYLVNAGRLADASVIEGWKGTVMFVAGVSMIPFWTWLSEKLDKPIMVHILLVGGMIGHALNWFCLRPDMPYLQLIPAVFNSGVAASFWLILPSMKADVADYDELKTTRRREGSLNAFYSWFIKASVTCSAGLGGVVLQLTGFDVKAPDQPAAVLARMKIAYVALPILIWSLCLICLAFYQLNRRRMAEIRAQLEAVRGKV